MTKNEQRKEPETRSADPASWTVGVDGSDCAAHALTWAANNAPGRAERLRVVSAWQAPLYGPYPVVGPMNTPYDADALRDAAEREAQRLADEAALQLDMPVEPFVGHGSPSAVLLDASELGSLLVIGSRGRGGFSRLMLGSTSHQCATHATVPTVVVPHDATAESADRILVGIDGSPNSLAALHWAIDFAQPGAKLHVVWVWDASPLAVGADQFFFPEATDLATERFEHTLDGVAADVAEAQLSLSHEFIEGSARTMLAECSREADLVVVGARGHGAVASALLGSVSTWLLHHVHTPIVVVPQDDEDAQAAG